jgi:hypothetical protein
LPISPDGPLLDILVGVSHPREEALKAASQPIPAPVPVRALIDTGASCSCLDSQIITRLALTPTGSIPGHTPSTGTTPYNFSQFDISLIIPLQSPTLIIRFACVPIIAADLASQGLQALIGRDILRLSLFVYDGQEGIFTISF